MLNDRRIGPREKRALFAEIHPLGLTDPHRCSIGDISEGGMFVCVPLSYGLNVGQRCEIRFAAQAAASLSDEPCYATVIRTEVLSEGERKLLGAGLRFDQPLFL